MPDSKARRADALRPAAALLAVALPDGAARLPEAGRPAATGPPRSPVQNSLPGSALCGLTPGRPSLAGFAAASATSSRMP